MNSEPLTTNFRKSAVASVSVTANPSRPAMTDFSGNWNYPRELPVVEHRQEILDALKSNQVVVVVSDTGSGKTTQLPKMVAEAMGPRGGRIGCTQPRRIAAASVAKRVAEELSVPLGGFVGYQVRFEDKTTRDTRIKFMTDGILLAETQGDPELRQYEVLILDEAHERSLNIDFLLGYLKRLLERRKDLKVVISSATLDAGSFAAFFACEGKPVPVIEAPGRMFPVAEFFLPPNDDEDLPHIENSFFIDVVRIAKRMDYASPSSGNTRMFINSAIRRLYETNFRVLMTAESPEAAAMMRKKYGLDDDTMDFRFITDIKSQFQEGFAPEGVDANVEDLPTRARHQLKNYEDLTDEELAEYVDPFHESELKRVRLWKISIDSHLFNRLKDKEARSIFVAHEEILKERSGLAQTLYNLLNHKIGRTNRKLTGGEEQKISTSFERLHQLLWPGRRFERFEEHFFALLRRHSKTPEALAKAITEANISKRTKEFRPQKVVMFGFVFLLSVQKGEWHITIYRDRNDEINGDNSYHNRMLAKSSSQKS